MVKINMPFTEQQRIKLGKILQPVEQKTKWIGNLFYKYLNPIPPDATICVLNTRHHYEELLHLRNFAGHKPHIFAVSNLQPNETGRQIIDYTNTIYIQVSVYMVAAQVAQIINKNPDLVIIRNLEMVQSLAKPGESTHNYELLEAVLSWVKMILQQNGQMLMTFYRQEERNFMATFLHQNDLRYRRATNTNVPESVHIKYGDTIITPDNFVIKIPN